ncbi:DUF523 and DUF1722 domain-containing protein [Terasakiella sp. SH-1]|uniref:YbgA family protein n=1 Tax=Terasakiella sp. SH-1 TaxID=2560057 RepID=UPI0010736765|nr:DUF523 and DUF1722 domain-containing protein [Terasakiella sp. SH-1]
MDKKLKIGVSSCLLGQEVRYNGGHCHNRFVTKSLGTYAEFVPTCPETAIGMGIPRETVRLERSAEGKVEMLAPKSGHDFTQDMRAFSKSWCEQLDQMDLDGFVFKKNSPSCGVFRVKIYQNGQPAQRRGRGLFAQEVMDRCPELPVEEDGRLADPMLREQFINRVFAFRRVKDVFKGDWKRKDIIAFHAREKMLLMAHHPQQAKVLGRLLGNVKSFERDDFKMVYIKEFMACVNHKASRGKQVNALMHMAGYLKKKQTAQGRAELNQLIAGYQRGQYPLSVPLTLMTHMVRRFEQSYLAQQSYLKPHPQELALRNYS